jgi:hypothetical protein
MYVDPKDGRCRECGGALTITDADDVTLVVTCTACGERYPVEHDAFNGGYTRYWPALMAKKLHEGGAL